MSKKIFIDCGANIGQSIIHFNTLYRDSKDYKIYSFEGNPKLISEINKIHKKLIDEGKLEVFNKVVWKKDGEIKFYISREDSLGSSTNKNKWNVNKNNYVIVESIDLSKWIKENFNKNDFIVLKMDIEGAEYEVVPHMLKTGVISYINKFYLEGHYHRILPKENQVELKKLDEEIEIECEKKYPNVLCTGQWLGINDY